MAAAGFAMAVSCATSADATPGSSCRGIRIGGAVWEQPGALNGSQLHATAPNSAQQHSPRPAVFRLRRSESVQGPASHGAFSRIEQQPTAL